MDKMYTLFAKIQGQRCLLKMNAIRRLLICQLRHHHQSQIPKISSTSRAWEIHHFADSTKSAIENELQFTKTRRPPVITHPDHLLIHSEAVSLNPIDLQMLTGYGSSAFHVYRNVVECGQFTGDFPLTPGHDFAGIVADVGPTAFSAKLTPGTPVMGATMPFSSSTGGGCLSDYILAPLTAVAKRPEKLDPVVAAGVSFAGLTAWSAVRTAGLNPQGRTSDAPKRVLVTGATGAVGSLAVQLARIAGAAHLTVTVPSGINVSETKALLAVDEVITAPDLPSSETKFDVIIDCLRPPFLTKPESQNDCGFQAFFPLLRNLDSSSCKSRYVTLNPPLLTYTDKWGLVVGSARALASLAYSNFHALVSEHGSIPLRWAYFEPSAERLAALADWVLQGQLRVPIDEVFSFDRVPEAFTKLAAGTNRGKIVIRVE